ncbi:enoyl-CoA hydratase-related protein [Octadecabacter sp.]|nr:enoyl-CoA hydratase-related protein [Octadecabacter sp.]
MTHETDHPLLFEVEGPIAKITLNRPKQRNAVNVVLGDAMRDAITRFEAAPDLQVAILCGNGPVFSAGMDLQAVADGHAENIVFGEGGFGGLVGAKRTKPIIAAVHGAALAGGFELMLSCDLVIAAQDTLFGLPEPKIGLIAGGGGAIRLARQLPKVIANEMLLTGEPVTTETALKHGLVNDVVHLDSLWDRALELAKRIACNAPLSTSASLALSHSSQHVSEDALWAESDAALRSLMQTSDAIEGAQAFIEKRQPKWRGV